MEIRISVRNLVEFILRSGDIDNRKSGALENAMQEGSRIHRMLQKRMGDEYQPEVFLRYVFETEHYQIVVEGRADGIITDQTGLVTVDEIKTTYKDVAKMKEPLPVHLAQAKVYAAIYGIQNDKDIMRVRMTYCNVETEELQYFYEESTVQALREWFEDLLEQYKKWADYEYEWKQKRQDSIEKLQFPFSYREGQKELASYVYQTIYHKKKLFIEAPTGVGKTISTIFPSVKALGNGMGDKIFYLTAKTITRTVAENTFSLLRDQGLQFKSVVLTAKDKICFMEETECNPEHCPFAKGHFDRINDAVYDLLIHSHSFTREVIEEYARKHNVCPFEFCLDMSLFADGIIGDYNYVFDPHVYLKRFFGEGVQGNYIFLVDEAHNLLERGREMYSAVLHKEAFLQLKKQIKEAQENLHLPVSEKGSTGHAGRIRDFGPKLERQLEKCNKELLLLKRECENYQVLTMIDTFVQALMRLHDTMDKYLEENDDSPVRKDILDFFFEISHFLDIYERVDDNYVMYSQIGDDGGFLVKLFCVNPSVNLQECMARSRSTILFSATLLPIQYYKKLLGGTSEDYEVYAKSVFNPEKRALYVSSDVTSKYTRRSSEEFYNIARYIYEIVKNRHGNYMVFFPSHMFLSQVYEAFCDYFAEETMECVCQEEYMNETAREAFLAKFEGNEDCDLSAIQMEIDFAEEEAEDRSLIGFCVMGGIFSEGIDLKHDSLIGVIVVGTGIPQVCNERELLKQFFDAQGENGFDYAYRFPGMNKVLQAAGRVIRTAEDVGVIALLDERFLQYTYQKLFPREWESFEVVTQDTIAKRVERFWDSWL
ncbi:MAG: ATP-dependent DNA helicase [Lachnospiraceae bacterium]